MVHSWKWGFPGGSVIKNPPAKAEDSGSVPGLGRSPGEGNGKSSSILAWKIPWTEEPGRLQSMGLKRVWHNWAIDHTHTQTCLQLLWNDSEEKTEQADDKANGGKCCQWVSLGKRPTGVLCTIHETFLCEIKNKKPKPNGGLWSQ